jgi:hypothetical protein
MSSLQAVPLVGGLARGRAGSMAVVGQDSAVGIVPFVGRLVAQDGPGG